MRRWEYHTELNLDLDPEGQLNQEVCLNKIGLMGWELVSVFSVALNNQPLKSNIVWVFKREMQS